MFLCSLFVFSFLRQEISSGFVGFGTDCFSSPQCISPYLAMLGKVLFMSQIYAFSSEISRHTLPSYLCHHIPVRLSQAVVVLLFPDQHVACTHWGTCFPDRLVRVMSCFSGLVCGCWWWLGVAGSLGRWRVHLHASTQVMVGSFYGDGSGCFSIWFLYILYFQCIIAMS
jgi:hypothetical protein